MSKWRENKQMTWQKMFDSVVFSFYVKNDFISILLGALKVYSNIRR